MNAWRIASSISAFCISVSFLLANGLGFDRLDSRMTQDRTIIAHRSQRERMLAGKLYDASDPELSAARRRAKELMVKYNRIGDARNDEARQTLAELIGEFGENVTLEPPIYLDYGENISIGPGSFANFNLTALDVARIRIGADCKLGPNVQLLTATHPIDPETRRLGLEAGKPITIGDNVWIGGGAIVCPGVTIGDNSVIGAGAVVTRDVPANVVAIGNPARVSRSI
jgi:maltose O-acetyltransferase